MEDNGRVLRDCLASAASELSGFNYGRFRRERGVDDFLYDESENPSESRDLAARALAELCVADCASGDQVVCLAVVDFLDKTCGTPRVDADRIQRLRDLKTLLQSQADQRQYRAWVQSWYP
jgi:hypothetical protein